MNYDEEIRRLQMQINDLRTRMGSMSNSYGWIGSAWHKIGMPLNYSDTLRGITLDTDLDAGTNTLSSTAVPAGEIWVVTNIAVSYVGTVSACWMLVTINNGSADTAYLYSVPGTTVVSGQYYTLQATIVLEPGDKINLYVYSATATDDARLHISGYKCDIDQ